MTGAGDFGDGESVFLCQNKNHIHHRRTQADASSRCVLVIAPLSLNSQIGIINIVIGKSVVPDAGWMADGQCDPGVV